MLRPRRPRPHARHGPRRGGRGLLVAALGLAVLSIESATLVQSAPELHAAPTSPAAASTVRIAPAARPALATSVLVSVGSPARRYRLHVPTSVSETASGAPRALVVAFHAAGSSTRQQERASGLSALADRAGFVVVYPEGRGGAWAGDSADERFVRAVVADVATRVRVDPRRVYATGISNGALMADRAACGMGDLFAAIATVAGTYEIDADACRPARPVPVLAVHGLRDRLAPYAGRPGRWTGVEAWATAWAARNGCATAPATRVETAITTRAWTPCAAGGDVVLHTVPALGHAWPGDPTVPAARSALDATAAMWVFFAAHPMPAAIAER